MVKSSDVVVRRMQPVDFAAGVRLCRIAGWNQQEADWQLFHGCNPTGCFVAEHEGEVIGTATSINYANRSSWVGMVLVDPSMRRRGVGTLLLTTAFEGLADCACIKLDATPAGKALYDTLGFVDEYRLARMICPTIGNMEAPGRRVRPMRETDLAAVIALDSAAFGVARPAVIRGLFTMAPEYAWVTEDLSGFCCGRHGERFEHLGPIQAANRADAQSLAAAVLGQLRGKSVVTDIRLHDAAWRDWLEAQGFQEERAFIRMVKGRNLAGVEASHYSISGPELG